jgi:hypothetical protein
MKVNENWGKKLKRAPTSEAWGIKIDFPKQTRLCFEQKRSYRAQGGKKQGHSVVLPAASIYWLIPMNAHLREEFVGTNCTNASHCDWTFRNYKTFHHHHNSPCTGPGNGWPMMRDLPIHCILFGSYSVKLT